MDGYWSMFDNVFDSNRSHGWSVKAFVVVKWDGESNTQCFFEYSISTFSDTVSKKYTISAGCLDSFKLNHNGIGIDRFCLQQKKDIDIVTKNTTLSMYLSKLFGIA